MGGGNMIVKRALVGIHDVYRGVFLNRGVFVKAPPGFFEAYPSDFEPPMIGYEKLTNVHLRTIESWDAKTGMLAPKVEIPTPEPTLVSTPIASSEQKVAEPIAKQAAEVVEDTKSTLPRKVASSKRQVKIR